MTSYKMLFFGLIVVLSGRSVFATGFSCRWISDDNDGYKTGFENFQGEAELTIEDQAASFFHIIPNSNAPVYRGIRDLDRDTGDMKAFIERLPQGAAHLIMIPQIMLSRQNIGGQIQVQNNSHEFYATSFFNCNPTE